MAASAVFVLDAKGKPIISRDFRGEVAYSCVERFNMRVAEMESENIPVPPIFLGQAKAEDAKEHCRRIHMAHSAEQRDLLMKELGKVIVRLPPV